MWSVLVPMSHCVCVVLDQRFINLRNASGFVRVSVIFAHWFWTCAKSSLHCPFYIISCPMLPVLFYFLISLYPLLIFLFLYIHFQPWFFRWKNMVSERWSFMFLLSILIHLQCKSAQSKRFHSYSHAICTLIFIQKNSINLNVIVAVFSAFLNF